MSVCEMLIVTTPVVSFKLMVEDVMWSKYNKPQADEFRKRNAIDIRVIKKIEKRYHNKPNNKDYEQFFLTVDKLEWL